MPYAATIYAVTVVRGGHLMPYAAAIYASNGMDSRTHITPTQPVSTPTSLWTLGDNMDSSSLRSCWEFNTEEMIGRER